MYSKPGDLLRFLFALAALGSTGACARPSPEPVTPIPGVVAARLSGNLYARIPAELGAFKLTERTAINGIPTDSLYRFRDSTRTNVSVIIYNVSPDAMQGADPQQWTSREGEKFRAVQAAQRERGKIADYVVAFSDTARLSVGSGSILEHSIASPTRFPNGNIAVEMQYLYLIDGKFVKVRATVPEQGWQRTGVPSFARALARRMAGG